MPKKPVKNSLVQATKTTVIASAWMLIGGVIAFLLLMWFIYHQGGKAQLAKSLVDSYKHQQELAIGDSQDASEVLRNLARCDIYCQWMQYATD